MPELCKHCTFSMWDKRASFWDQVGCTQHIEYWKNDFESCVAFHGASGTGGTVAGMAGGECRAYVVPDQPGIRRLMIQVTDGELTQDDYNIKHDTREILIYQPVSDELIKRIQDAVYSYQWTVVLVEDWDGTWDVAKSSPDHDATKRDDAPDAMAYIIKHLENPPDPDRIAIHHEIAEEIASLLDRKRAAYGTENIRAFGEFGILVRVSDKIERLKNMTQKGLESLNDESVEDTWQDLAGYAILALMLRREG